MRKVDQYRAHAAECQRLAERSTDEADAAQWLTLAQSWMRLVHNERVAAGQDPEPAPGRWQQQQQPQPSNDG